MKYEQGGVSGNSGEPTKVEVPSGRLRVSAWTDGPINVIGRMIDRRAGKFQRDPSKVQACAGVLDDISILTTFSFGFGGRVKWAHPMPAMFRDIVIEALDLCHENGIQLVAGYSIGDEGAAVGSTGQSFLKWLRSNANPTRTQYAQELVEFAYDTHGVDFDGIGFDIELNGMTDSDAACFQEFYGEMANQLAARGKFMSVATGIHHSLDISMTPAQFRAQPFSMAVGHPNMIIRPMAYDNFVLNEAKMFKWHEDICDYAINQVGLTPSQFQLGIKTSSNDAHVIATMPKEIPMAERARRCCYRSAGVANRCEKILRDREVGVINFAGLIDYGLVNKALNPDEEPAGTAGEPLQAPLAKALP